MRQQSLENDAEPFVDLEDIAVHLKTTKDRVYRLNVSGLPRFTIGRQVRYRISEVDAWLESRRRGDSPDPK